jgi:hypothetical protein
LLLKINSAFRRLEDARSAPPGLYLLTEEERIDTLNTLQKAKADTLEQYNRLPIANKTQATERFVHFNVLFFF